MRAATPPSANGLALADRRGTVVRSVEQRADVAIGFGQPQHRRAARGGHRPAGADRGIDQRTDRTPVLRSGKTVVTKPVGEARSAGCTLRARRSDDRVERSIDVWTHARCRGHGLSRAPHRAAHPLLRTAFRIPRVRGWRRNRRGRGPGVIAPRLRHDPCSPAMVSQASTVSNRTGCARVSSGRAPSASPACRRKSMIG